MPLQNYEGDNDSPVKSVKGITIPLPFLREGDFDRHPCITSFYGALQSA